MVNSEMDYTWNEILANNNIIIYSPRSVSPVSEFSFCQNKIERRKWKEVYYLESFKLLERLPSLHSLRMILANHL